MNLGLGSNEQAMIRRCHAEAVSRGLYSPGCYMASCPEEYWAEGTQSWFDATARVDVNCGVNTREKLRRHDPALGLLLFGAYGDGSWRFTQTVSESCREVWQRKQQAPLESVAWGSRCAQRVKAQALASRLCVLRKEQPSQE